MKLLFLIFSFLLTFNVSAITCSYNIDGTTYSVDFEVDLGKADWRKICIVMNPQRIIWRPY